MSVYTEEMYKKQTHFLSIYGVFLYICSVKLKSIRYDNR